MICENCIYFQGIQNECDNGSYVDDGLEATNCNDWIYKGDNE